MCRIAGIVSRNKSIDDLHRQVKAMCDTMRHGGPDDEGVYLNAEMGIALGHRRLALLDLSASGHQPMPANQEQVWISYNGEVYNFREIRSELESLGHVFTSATDTEVVLKAYLQWGTASFSRLNGMFALSLVDIGERKVYLVRDAVGMKPLYYSLQKESLVFASEVKAFKCVNPVWENNSDWKLLFLAFGHIPEPYTTLTNVYALPKGCFFAYDLNAGMGEIKRYKQFTFAKDPVTSKVEAQDAVRTMLYSAVKRHLIADVPVGLFLSGGIDSSLLAALLVKAKSKEEVCTLSVVFNEEKFSEEKQQQAVVDRMNIRHRFYPIGRKDFEYNLNGLLSAYDQPSNDAVNTWFISKYAKENGLKAVLSGLGSDEVFGGYPSFNRVNLLLRLKKLSSTILKGTRFIPDNRLKRLEWLSLKDSTGMYLALRGIFTPSEIASMLDCSKEAILEKMKTFHFEPRQEDEYQPDELACWLEFNRYMQNQLLKDADYMSMQHGLELRLPFLDQQLLDTVFSIAPKLLYRHNGVPKQFLLDTFQDDLPEGMGARKKMGFTFPFQNWLGKTEQIRDAIAGCKIGKNVLYQFDKGNLHWSKLWTYYLSQEFEA